MPACRGRAGASCLTNISSRATSCWPKRLAWKPTSEARWRRRTTLRLDNLASQSTSRRAFAHPPHLPQVLKLVQSGQAKALAVTSAKRTALLPDVPTLEESGIAGFDLWSWWGVVGPAGMPANVVNALNPEIDKMLTSPELSIFLSNEGAEAKTTTPQQFGDLMRLETQRWIKVAHEANISID